MSKIDHHSYRFATAQTAKPFYAEHGKRAMDVIVVLLGLPIALPLLTVLAVLVRLDGGPAFYRQTRIGRGGVRFGCWKLRSMALDADDTLALYLAQNPQAAAEWAQFQKLRDDPRVTRLGRFLRSSSLDELPQIWNVLRGDMSLVGPRPFTPDQIPLYSGGLAAYASVRPGITGLWQLTARNSVAFADRVRFDLAYVRTLSLRQDLRLLLGTVRVVLRGSGH